jgi:hypothetical protein
VEDTNFTFTNLFPDKMNINLDMFGPLMMNGVVGKIDGADIVTVNDRSLLDRTT